MNFVYFLGWFFFRAIYKFYFRWRVFNPERVPLTGAGHPRFESRQFS